MCLHNLLIVRGLLVTELESEQNHLGFETRILTFSLAAHGAHIQ